MTRRIGSFIARSVRRARDSRRGSVIVLAVGILGIITIAALSYVTIVRLDRTSAVAAATRENYQKQVREVASHIQELITADLWGNKIVTESVPFVPRPGSLFRSRPELFEDNDFRDIPSVYLPNFMNRENPGPTGDPRTEPRLEPLNEGFPGGPARYAIGFSDDAWLASTEPRWEQDIRQTSYWPQVSNLRDGYYYDEGASDTEDDDRWVRRDGRYVDLGQWFLRSVDGYANAGLDLMSFTDTTIDGRLGPRAGVEQPVFNRPANVMAYFTPPVESQTLDTTTINPITPRDERQWVDTDGDLRPDARWQQLERLGRRFGLEWVVAARIIDLSAFININSSMGMTVNSGFLADSQHLLGGGSTPADIDIRRLLEGSATSDWNLGVQGAPARQISNAFVRTSLADHLRTVGADFVLEGMRNLSQGGGSNPFADYGPLNATLPGAGAPELDRTQRDAWWIGAGASPTYPLVNGARAIPDSSLVDLFTFRATNHSGIVSPVETAFDGPEGSPLLPSIDLTPAPYGPMRSREQPAEARRYEVGDQEPVPTSRQLKESVRAYLTTINGQSLAGPVPMLNRRDKRFYREVSRPKINLALNTFPVKHTDDGTDRLDVQRTFESLVWALAPLATDQPLTRELAEAGAGIGYANPSIDAHYGGGAQGPARNLNFLSPTALGGEIGKFTGGSGFAVTTAAMMAACIRDAVDPDDLPTIVLLGNDDALLGSPGNDRSQKIGAEPSPPSGAFYEVGFSVAQGDVSTVQPLMTAAGGTALELMGGPTPERDKMMIVAGLDRQPFLVEATTIAFYSNFDIDSSDSAATEGDITRDDAIGSAVVVQVRNPWPNDITTSDRLRVAIAAPNGSIGDSDTAGRVILTIPAGQTIGPDETMTFYWLFEGAGTSAWATIGSEVENFIQGQSGTDQFVRATESNPDPINPVPFETFGAGGSVLLLYEHEVSTGGDKVRVVLDRMTAPLDASAPFPNSLTSSVAASANGGVFSLDPLFAPGGDVGPFDQAYFELLGYNATAMDPRFMNTPGPTKGPPRRESILARLAFASTVSRCTERGDQGGFRSYLFERPDKNRVVINERGHAFMDPRDGGADPVDAYATIPLAILDPAADGLSLGDSAVWELASKEKTNSNWSSAEIPPFQLFVPSVNDGAGYLHALSELGLISTYAHTCINWANRDKLDAWSTVGEKLAQSLSYNFQSGGGLNPYLGVLDPSRFVLGGNGMDAITALPDAFRIPLALRVFDCFETQPVRGPLVQGRVNINTAPEAVLRSLPFLDVRADILCRSGQLLAGEDRYELLREYRDPDPLPSGGTVTNIRSQSTQIPGLRPGNPGAVVFNPNQAPEPASMGFHTPAELAILDDWQSGNGMPNPDSGSSPLGFLEVATDTGPVGGASFRPLELIEEYADSDDNPSNDAEERLAVYRALSNVVSTRSDVFLAWFVLRGYDPQAIELIPAGGAADNRLRSMDDERYDFGPVYETRWLAVFDRSNVKRPTDRARLVMLVEIPKATP